MKRILCFGDSNTWGYNPLNGSRYGEDIRWTKQLGAILGADYEIIEEGLNGRTTVFSDLLEPYRCGLDYIGPCVLSHTPFDLLVIMLGTNDTKERFHVSAREIGYGIEELIKRVRFLLGEESPQILIAAPIALGLLTEGEFSPESRKRAAGLAEEYRRVAEEFHCGFLDGSRIVPVPGPDEVHMTPEQHGKIAEGMAVKIREMMENRKCL